jgi:hypothetical protein
LGLDSDAREAFDFSKNGRPRAICFGGSLKPSSDAAWKKDLLEATPSGCGQPERGRRLWSARRRQGEGQFQDNRRIVSVRCFGRNPRLLKGSLKSNVIVNAGGTLAGSGKVDGNVTNKGGTVSPDPLHIDGAYSQTGGAITFDIGPNGKGGFLESALVFDPGDPVSIRGAKIVFDFLGGASPLAFFDSGAFDLDAFFQESDGSLFSNDFNLESLLAGDSFTTDMPGFDVTGFGANGAVDLIQTSIPEPSTWAMLIAGFVGLGLAGWRRGGGCLAPA